MDWKIPLAEPDLGDEEIESVVEVLRGKWLSMGPATAAFEKEFASAHEVRHAFAVNNCTAGLHLAALACDIGPGDEVICPALTFVATANAVRYTGADVVFADVISETDLTIDPEEVRRRITPRTRAIVVVHYAGYPCLMNEINSIAREYKLFVIEDCAHAPLAWIYDKECQKRYVGSIGDVGCFSFFGNKNMTTGEGGMVTTNDGKIAEKIRLFRSHGMTTLSYDRFKGHARSYDVVCLGYNYRMNDVSSAIGLAQLRKCADFNAARRNVVRWYYDAFDDCQTVIMPFRGRPLEQSACHIMPVIVPNHEAAVRARLEALGVQTSKHYILVNSFSIYHENNFVTRYPKTQAIVTLPLFPGMKREQVQTIRHAFSGL